MTHPIKERDFQKTCRELNDDIMGSTCCQEEDQRYAKEALYPLVEARLVNATWVLRRLPDREIGFQKMKGMLWPETLSEPGCYPAPAMPAFEAKRRVRISAKDIDAMQPALDLLLLLPDIADRQLVFWACWHQEGEVLSRVPWVKVRRSMGTNLSRWTLKRRYEGAVKWLCALIALQA